MEIRNRSAFHEFFIEDKYDAGMVLTGTEVKALRSGKASFNDSFCTIDHGEVWLRNLHIAEYEYGTYANHPPLRERKLTQTATRMVLFLAAVIGCAVVTVWLFLPSMLPKLPLTFL